MLNDTLINETTKTPLPTANKLFLIKRENCN